MSAGNRRAAGGVGGSQSLEVIAMSRRVPVILVTLGLLLGAGLLVVPVAFAGGGCHPGANAGAERGDGPASVVRMDVCTFAPTIARVPVGSTVRFLNTDVVPHVVTGERGVWESAQLDPGESFSQVFAAAGIHPYTCPLHPGMVGAIVVGGEGAAADVEPAVAEPDTSRAAAVTSTGLDAPAAIGLGGLSGLAVLGLGSLLVRRRAGRPTEG